MTAAARTLDRSVSGILCVRYRWTGTTASGKRDLLQRVDKRPSATITTRLLSLNRGAVLDTATTNAVRAAPWNKGKLVGQKPPLKLNRDLPLGRRLEQDAEQHLRQFV